MFPIFSMGRANNLVGMGRDGFCQGISLIFNMLKPPVLLWREVAYEASENAGISL